MKSSLALLLVAGGGAFAYFMYKKNQASQPSMPLSNPSNAQPAQPSQQYPWQAQTPARVDNANQPWYNGSLSFQGGPVDTLNSVAGSIKAGSSVVHSIADVWGDFSNFFGGDDNSSNLIASADDAVDWGFGDDLDEMFGSSEDVLGDWGNTGSEMYA